MRFLQFAFLASLIAISACAQKPDAADTAVVGSNIAKECSFSLWPMEPDGTRGSAPLITPSLVASIMPAKPLYDGDVAMIVTLTESGARRFEAMTRQRIGSGTAAYCGDGILSRNMINGPVTGPFRVSIVDQPGT